MQLCTAHVPGLQWPLEMYNKHLKGPSQPHLFVCMQEFGYYILFGARANKGNQCETTKDDFTDFTEHNISNAIKVSLNHVISWHRENWQRLPRAL